MNGPSPTFAVNRSLVVALALLALAFILFWARVVLIPTALAVLLSFVLTPFVRALQNRGLRRTYAVGVVVLITLLAVGGVVTAVSVQLHELARDLPARRDNIAQKLRDVMGTGPGVVGNLLKMIDDLGAALHKDEPPDPARPVAIPVTVVPEKTSGLSLVPQVAGPVLAQLGSVGLIVALTVSMLMTREDLRNRLIRVIGDDHLTSSTRAFDEATGRISRYLLVQVMVNSCFGTVFGLGLMAIGVPYAILWGFLAAVLRFVPVIGTWLAAFFPLLVSLAEVGWVQPALVVGYAILLGVATNNIVEPLLVSRSTGVSPVALVVAAAFWTWLWGPIGLILSTPMTVCLSVLGKYVPALRFLNVLLGTEPALPADQKYYQRLLARDEGEAAELIETYLEAHTLEELCDDVLLPALARGRAEQERGLLDAGEVAYIVATTRELLAEAAPEPEGEQEGGASPVVCFGCPAHDEREEVALEMLRRVLGRGRARLDIISSKATAAEVVQRVADEKPPLVCIASVPPRSNAQARYLCKRLRAKFPQLPVVVGCWGGREEDAKAADHLRAAGASQVTTSLRETRLHVAPLLQIASHLEAQET